MKAAASGLLAAASRALTLPLRALIFLYQRLVSPVLPSACRYHPTCSAYAAEALRVHGLFRGAWLAGARLGRCNPWGAGGLDPVPARPTASRASPAGAPPPAAPLSPSSNSSQQWHS